MPIYMKFGAKIKGDVTSDGHKDWIKIDSFQWGIGRGISSSQGSSLNRTATGASVSEVTISKMLDPASTDMMQDLFKGNLETEPRSTSSKPKTTTCSTR